MVEDVLVPVLEIGPLPRILDDVEQELVAGDMQTLARQGQSEMALMRADSDDRRVRLPLRLGPL
jgi:hypothetical protein